MRGVVCYYAHMRLLICTQTVDRPDSALGFFHRWIEALSTHADAIEVICLNEGVHALPSNVRVHSLGKEHEKGSRLGKRMRYIARMYVYLWRMRGLYDAVLVHMNQEYVLLGGPLWLITRTPVYLWRNHYDGSFLTHLAVRMSTKVFCTSRFSYTARFGKTIRMPIGVDVDSLHEGEKIDRKRGSVLFLARMDPSKRPEMLIDALGILAKRGVSFSATFVGGPSDTHSDYQEVLHKRAQRADIDDRITFTGAVPNTETYRYYRSHDVFVNCSKSGMFDKTMFKAAAAGCLVLAASRDFLDLAGSRHGFGEDNTEELADKLEESLTLSETERTERAHALVSLAHTQTLPKLALRLAEEMGMTGYPEVVYLANIRFPNDYAHGKQVREMCNALSQRANVTLVVNARHDARDPYEFGLSRRIRLVHVWTPNLLFLDKVGFLFSTMWFACGTLSYVLQRRTTVVLTRDYICAIVPSLTGVFTGWETHRGEWNILVRIAIRVGAKTIAITRGLQDLYCKHGVPMETIMVAPDGVDLDRFRRTSGISRKEARERLGLSHDDYIAIYNGHLHTWKGAGVLAQAVDILPIGYSAMFMGGFDADIAAFRAAYPNERIKLLGRKSDGDRPLYLRAADCTVLPNTGTDEISAKYTSPLKLFGYMASGTPIVASDLPSVREILDDTMAYFAIPDDPASFAKAIAQVTEEPSEAGKKAERALAAVEEYSWERRAEAILTFLGV